MAMAELCLDVTVAWNVVLAVWMRLGTLLPSKDHEESLLFAVRLSIVRVRVRVRGTLIEVTSKCKWT